MVPDRLSRRHWLFGLAGTMTLSGCGTILYPERKGQPAGCIDWKVVALDGIGLLFFFIPGVIAFAVDFNNGTIYLPPDECAERSAREHHRLTAKTLPQGKLSRPGVEAAIAEHTGRKIDLEAGRYETRSLQHIDDFWSTHDEFAPA
ncbi:MAG TPA: hypothetical protein VFG20_01520 [Planctomycetaceae bacterium]|jgi:hypothetical protein|nr:hypothetical protein [Planctomycetaceae bacterium]